MALLTVTEAAGRYPLSGSQIRRLVAAGVVKGARVGPLWQVDSASLERYLASERKPGPTPRITRK
jgi:excisionase family DNA binding protein